MGNLLMRRREMILANAAPSTLIYKLDAPVSTENYDTGVLLFDTPDVPKSFTIVCKATINNYNWTGYQAIFALGNGASFRFGRLTSYYETTNNVSAGGAGNFYTGFAMNNTYHDAVTKKGHSVFARNNGAIERIFAVRFDSATLRCEANNTGSLAAPSSAWWTISQPLDYPTSTLKLNYSTGSTCTVEALEIYNYAFSDDEVNAALTRI